MVPVLTSAPTASGIEVLPVSPEGSMIFGVGEILSVLEEVEIDSEPLSVHRILMPVWDGFIAVGVAKSAGVTFVVNEVYKPR